ncbi:MAG: serine hydrolase [Pseudomonadota bacterium]
MAVPQNEPLRCGLSWAAKVACSGYYLSGRAPRDVLLQSIAWTYAPPEELKQLKGRSTEILLEGLSIEHDEADQRVTLTRYGESGHARMHGGMGAMVVPELDQRAHYEAPAIVPQPQADVRLDQLGGYYDDRSPPKVDQAGLRAALDTAFADPRQMTNAYLVLHRGRVVAERYRPPFSADTRFESWSMGKSLASSLVGIAHEQGALDLDEDGLFDEWRSDDRRSIRLRNLLNMSSGLTFSGSFGKGEDNAVKQRDGLFLDHIYVYASGCDAHRFCTDKPLEIEPGSAVRYRNCDPLLVMRLLRERCAPDLDDFLRLPQAQLFDAVGSSGFVLETDPYGNFLISGHDFARARDWARIGQLWLQRGEWQGTQVMSKAYVDFALTPATGSEEPYYGGFVALNRSGLASGLPPDAFWFSGGGQQRTIVVPSLDLVIVRMGHIFGAGFRLDDTLQKAHAQVCQAVA